MVESGQRAFKVIGPPVAYGLEAFRNRYHERELVRRHLFEPATRLVTITGRRGMGKSALAAKVVESLVQGRWPDGVELPELRGVVNASTRTAGITLERLFQDCARLFDADTERGLLAVWAGKMSTFDKIQRLMEELERGWYLLLLDNFEDKLTDEGRLTDSDLNLFIDLALRFGRGPRLLVTTQVPLDLGLDRLRLEARIQLDKGFPVEEGVDFLRELDHGDRAHIGELSEAELSRAVLAVYGIPRALELIVGVLGGDYATLPTLDELIKTFSTRDDIVASLAQQNYYRLNHIERSALDVIAAFGCPVPRDAIAWVIEPLLPDIDSVGVLNHLARVQMLHVDRGHRTYALHPMDTDFIRDQLAADGVWGLRALDRRIASWYASIALPDFEWRSLDDVVPLRLEFQHRIRAGDHEEAARVLDAIDDFMIWRGSAATVGAMHAEISGQLEDGDTRLAHLVGFALARLVTGPYAEALNLLEQAQALAADGVNPQREVYVQFLLGDVYRHLHRWAEAIEAMTKTVDLAGELGNWDREAHALLCISLIRAGNGEIDEALAVTDQLEGLAERTGEAIVFGRLGDARAAVYILAERWTDAITAAQSGIDAYERSGVNEAFSYARNSQGLASIALGRFEDAMDYFNRGWEDSTSVNTPQGEALCLYNQAWLHWVMGNYPAAKLNADSAQAVFLRCGGPDTPAAQALARAAQSMIDGLPDTAAQALREAAGATNNADLCPPAWLLREADRLVLGAPASD
jgi:tetratricopeptide (TPR) repeat protein